MLATLIIDHHQALTVLADIGIKDPATPPGSDRYLTILSWLIWAAVIACIGGIVVAGALLAYQRFQGGGGDAQGKIVAAMIGAALVASAGSIVNTIVFPH